MESGQILHIVTGVVVILGAAVAALLCDLLRSENERLRQVNVELLTRREAEQRRTELMLQELRLANPGGAVGLHAMPVQARAEQLESRPWGDPGETMEEARQLARQLLAAAAQQESAKLTAAPAPAPRRRNWELLLKGGAVGVARPKGELIPFETLQNHPDATARFGGR